MFHSYTATLHAAFGAVDSVSMESLEVLTFICIQYLHGFTSCLLSYPSDYTLIHYYHLFIVPTTRLPKR